MQEYHPRALALDFGTGHSPGVKRLLQATVGCFVLQILAGGSLEPVLGLVPGAAVGRLMPWQFVTYLFLHAGAFHLFFNMYALWALGRDVEAALGTRRFVAYYLMCGVAGGACAYLFYEPPAVIMGASGAIFGVMTAFAVLYPERVITLLVFFVIPVRMTARQMALALAGIELLFVVQNPHGGVVAHFAHLGGALCGYLYMRWSGFCRGGRPGGGRRGGGFHAGVTGEGGAPDTDDLLDKISRHGLGSLTEDEREQLRRASRR
jgi:membrane associated rhomboid family serine protease